MHSLFCFFEVFFAFKKATFFIIQKVTFPSLLKFYIFTKPKKAEFSKNGQKISTTTITDGYGTTYTTLYQRNSKICREKFEKCFKRFIVLLFSPILDTLMKTQSQSILHSLHDKIISEKHQNNFFHSRYFTLYHWCQPPQNATKIET